jgi:hypothetical protein
MIVSSGRLHELTSVTVVASSSSTSSLDKENHSTNINGKQTEKKSLNC